jgi:hypothetical protein
MSNKVLTAKIDAIYKKAPPEGESVRRASDDDIRGLIKVAETSEKDKRDGVSNAEARELGDFYVRLVNPQFASKDRPRVQASDTGLELLNAFFVAHNLPYGDGRPKVMNMVADVIKNAHLVPTEKPRTGSRLFVQVDRSAGGGLAYIDATNANPIVVRRDEDFFEVRSSDGPSAEPLTLRGPVRPEKKKKKLPVKTT